MEHLFVRVFGGSPQFWLTGGDVLNEHAMPSDSTKLLCRRFKRGGFVRALAGSKMEDFCFLLKKPKMPANVVSHPLLPHLKNKSKKRHFDCLQLCVQTLAHRLLLEPAEVWGLREYLMTDSKACSGQAQSDALVLLKALRLCKDVTSMPEGVATAHTAGETTSLDYSWHGRIG